MLIYQQYLMLAEVPGVARGIIKSNEKEWFWIGKNN